MRLLNLVFILSLIATCSCRTVRENMTQSEYESAFSKDLHEVKLLIQGQDALRERLRLIREAKTSIDLQTFIWSSDACGQLVFLELAKAAERGVRVRLMCDYLFVANDPEIIAAASLVPQLDIRLYNPASNTVKPQTLSLVRRGLFSMAGLNQRMHNKLMVVDETIAICGGRNIENTYYHESDAMNFKDLEIIVKGSVVTKMQASFNEFWDSKLAKDARSFKDVQKAIAGGSHANKNIRKIEQSDLYRRYEAILADPKQARQDRGGYSTVRNIAFFSDAPGKNTKVNSLRGSSHLNEVLIYSALRAKEKIWVQTPYVVLSDRAKAVFKKLRKDNPNLDIRISSNSMAATDNWMAYSFLYKNKRHIIDDLDIRLYEFNPLPADLYDYFPNYDRMLKKRTGKTRLSPEMIKSVSPKTHPFLCVHSKCMLIDDRLSFIGSYNLDPRSANLNTEVSIVIDDPALAGIMRRYLEQDFQTRNSWLVWKRNEPLVTKMLTEPMHAINTTKKALTTLDLWPYQNSCCYILKDGATPVPPGHDDFYHNYHPQGNFPRMPPVSDKEIYSRILKATGRVTQPIM